MKVKVKICGVRNLESAQAAVHAGADFLGFNFVFSSKRFIDPIEAKKIISNTKNKTSIVGVFQNSPYDYLNTLIDFLDLDFVQLHGEEGIDYIKKIDAKVIKKVDIYEFTNDFNNMDSEFIGGKNTNSNYFLLDRKIQGRGKPVNVDHARKISQRFPIFLAGGLNSDNVLETITKVKPFAVDIAGGVETNGKLDIKKIQEFIAKVKQYEI